MFLEDTLAPLLRSLAKLDREDLDFVPLPDLSERDVLQARLLLEGTIENQAWKAKAVSLKLLLLAHLSKEGVEDWAREKITLQGEEALYGLLLTTLCAMDSKLVKF